MRARLGSLELPEHPEGDTAPVEIPVRYDGADVAEVAELTGLTAEEVVRRHASGEYVVAYLGFSPGFGYLRGLDPVLHGPRRSTPATS
ncbi:MAG: allophanate hydrolase subunit 1, partial [Limnochordales bacterium]